MRAPVTVKLVKGVHPQTPIPAAARRHGWKHRTALVMDSYVPGATDMQFDATLFLQFLQKIDSLIGGTTRRIRMECPADKKDPALFSMAELEAVYRALPEDDHDLPEEIVWFEGEVAIGGGFAERWYAVGGPEIYHDSFTFSVFTRQEIFPALVASAREICTAANAELLAVHEGTPIGS